MHIECPACRAPMGLSRSERIISCGHCGARSVVEGHGYVPEYGIEPLIDEQTARRTLQKALRHPSVPEKMLKKSKMVAIELNYVPYNEITAMRMGSMVLSKEQEPLGSQEKKRKREEDTRIVLSEVHRVVPAVDLKNWGLERAQIDPLPEEVRDRLEPFDRARAAAKDKIQEPTLNPEFILRSMQESGVAATVQDNTEFLEKRFRRIFYPIWRIHYTYQGNMFKATVDGLNGRIMNARAPANEKSRILWLLGVSMFVAIILGKILRALVELARNPNDLIGWAASATNVIAFISLTGLAFIVIAIVVGWEQFRYPGVVVFQGDEIDTQKINRPENNRILVWLFEITEQLEKFISKRGSGK